MNALPPEIIQIELAPGYPAFQLKTQQCSATLALHGAHLTHWQPTHTPHPVLYTSPTAIYREGKAIRGGVPLCWPWFNAHPTAPEQHPSHGVARDRFWELESATVENGVAVITLILPTTTEIREHVPFSFQLKAIFTLGKTCKIELETTNLSSENIPIGGALHTYLALSSINNIQLKGLQNTPYLDTSIKPERDLTQQEDNLLIQNEVDSIYYGTKNAIRLTDSSWNRVIEVQKEGSLSTVIWNPWAEKAMALGDMPDDGYQNFACIEAANARHDTRILPPKETHRLSTTLSISSLGL